MARPVLVFLIVSVLVLHFREAKCNHTGRDHRQNDERKALERREQERQETDREQEGPRESSGDESSSENIRSYFFLRRCWSRREVYLTCGSRCAPTCSSPYPRPCISVCQPGCYCRPGYLRRWDGACVMPRECFYY